MSKIFSRSRPTYEQESLFGLSTTGNRRNPSIFERARGWWSVIDFSERTKARLRNGRTKREWREKLKARGLWTKGVKRHGD